MAECRVNNQPDGAVVCPGSEVPVRDYPFANPALGELAGMLEEMAPEFERAAEDFGRRIDEGGAD